MRIDDKGRELPLTPDQHFFVACWFNKIHQHSLDSNRVRTMNPRNILREFLRMYVAPHAHEDDRAMVSEEALAVLEGDPVMKVGSAAKILATLVPMLRADSKGKRPNEQLACHVARELLAEIETSYLGHSLRQLEDILLADPPIGTNLERQEQIAALTSGLLSTLIDGGAGLEALFQLYRQILMPAFKPKKYVFARKLGLLAAILKQEPMNYRVLFAIDNVTKIEDFPAAMGGITFAVNAPNWQSPVPPVSAYLVPNSRRVFAEFVTLSRDMRGAGSEAYSKISNVLDLARFEYERERVHLSEEYLISPSDRPEKIRRYAIGKVVPNPDGIGQITDLNAFVSSVDELLSSGRFMPEGRDRVISAFRLYRQGADANSFESKLANWWTAIEFLVRGLKGGKQIGSAVDHNVAPVLCLAYLGTLLVDIRNTLVKLDVQLVDPVTTTPIDLRQMPPADLYKVFSRTDIRAAVSASLAAEPFIQYRTDQVLAAIANPVEYLKFLQAHEQRIHWQIQRLWRARCDIVHSAVRPVSDVLLCANLEFYLKVTLMCLLADLRRIKTLSSPEEFFERKTYSYDRLREGLAKSSALVLEQSLATEWF